MNLPTTGWTTNANGSISLTVSGTFPSVNEADLLNSNTYLQIHTTAYAGGEIRGQVNFSLRHHLPSAADLSRESISSQYSGMKFRIGWRHRPMFCFDSAP